MATIAENLSEVHAQMDEACARAGTRAEDVTLIAVSKTVDTSVIREAYDAGQRAFGENRIQEWRRKTEELPDDIKWNIIGHLQTNKAKYIIVPENLLLQSVDRLELMDELEKLCERNDAHIDALVQLNLSREDTKSGLYEEDLPEFLEKAAEKPRVHLQGLMTIGPNTDDERRIREVFAQARKIYDDLKPVMPEFRWLSMGMSHDFKLAILEGSNMIRVGTAIFGERNHAV